MWYWASDRAGNLGVLSTHSNPRTLTIDLNISRRFLRLLGRRNPDKCKWPLYTSSRKVLSCLRGFEGSAFKFPGSVLRNPMPAFVRSATVSAVLIKRTSLDEQLEQLPVYAVHSDWLEPDARCRALLGLWVFDVRVEGLWSTARHSGFSLLDSRLTAGLGIFLNCWQSFSLTVRGATSCSLWPRNWCRV